MASISGTSGSDTLHGVAGEENDIAGNDGNDTLSGAGKSDLVLGGNGVDTIEGRNGHDDLFGGGGDDVIDGGNGGDWLSGDKGENTLIGGNGDDTFSINANIAGGDGTDQAFDTITDFDVGRQLRDMTYNDSIELKNIEGKDVVFQQNANGSVTLLIDGNERAVFHGSEEQPLTAANLLAATKFDGEPGSVEAKIVGSSGNDALNGVPGVENTIAGNAGDDVINGKGKDDTLLGNGGDDEINGHNGSDTLFGGENDDVLKGGNGGDTLSGDKGNDTLNGGNGNDMLTGGPGDDVFIFDNDDGNDIVTDFDNGNNSIELTSGGEYELDYDGTDTTMIYDSTTVVFQGVEVVEADITGALLA